MLWQRALFPNLFLACGVAISWMARAESISLVAKADTGLQEFRPTTTAGSSTSLRVGTVGTSGAGARVRALFYFEPSASIPAGSTVIAASPGLSVSLTVDETSRDFELRRMLVSWDETNATWLVRLPPDLVWSEPGGASGVDYAAVSSAVATLGSAGNYTFGSTAGLVADVQCWVDNPSKNYGWILLGADEVTDQTARLVNSRENASGQPHLTVEFDAPFRINSTTITTNQLCLAFQTAVGKSYVVERSANARNGDWTVVTNIPTVTVPGVVTICEPIDPDNRFYRVGRQKGSPPE